MEVQVFFPFYFTVQVSLSSVPPTRRRSRSGSRSSGSSSRPLLPRRGVRGGRRPRRRGDASPVRLRRRRPAEGPDDAAGLAGELASRARPGKPQPPRRRQVRRDVVGRHRVPSPAPGRGGRAGERVEDELCHELGQGRLCLRRELCCRRLGCCCFPRCRCRVHRGGEAGDGAMWDQDALLVGQRPRRHLDLLVLFSLLLLLLLLLLLRRSLLLLLLSLMLLPPLLLLLHRDRKRRCSCRPGRGVPSVLRRGARGSSSST